MNLRSSLIRYALALSLAAAAARPARAQIGLYINPVANYVTNSKGDTGPFAFLGQNSTSGWFTGVTLGGYYEVPIAPTLHAGIDIRDTILRHNNAGLNTFLVGGRVEAKPFLIPVRPYIQASVGVGSTHSPYSAIALSRFQYGVFAGADYTLLPHIDLRVIELGYGAVTTVNSASISATSTFPTSNVVSVSTGFVFRFR